MKFIQYSAVVALMLLAFACSEKETPGGVKYNLIKEGSGEAPEFGKNLVMYLELKDAKDSVWFSSKQTGYPVIIPVPDGSMEKDDGEYGVFKQLKKGDSAQFSIPASTVFTKTRRRPVPKNVEPNSLFKFTVGVKDVWTSEQVQTFQQDLMAKETRKAHLKDSVTINDFLKQKGIAAKSTPSGLYYVVAKEGKGPLVAEKQTAYVHYAGYLLNGTLFDTSLSAVAKANNFDNGNRNEPYPVVVNTGSVIRGWDEMLQLMNKGMKVTVYIPSDLAYGSESRGSVIPPNSILVFDMEVTDIK